MWKKILMSVLILTTFCPTNAAAQSNASVSFDGKRITVRGGSPVSVSAANGNAVVVGNDIRMELQGPVLTVDGRSEDIGDFTAIEVTLGDGPPHIEVDGRVV